jgi:uncharacterized peroxidase-related enzyme
VNHHGAGLRSLLGTAELPRALARDYRSADLSDVDRAMLDYAVKLTRSPHTVTVDDIDGLRGQGFDDRAILDVCQVTSYYNYVNRLADGLGVELEAAWAEDDLTLTRDEFEAGLAAKKEGTS